MSDKKDVTGISIAGLTLGIISVVTNLFWYICLPAGILAIVFGAKTIKNTEGKKGKASLVLGIIGLSIMIFAYIGLTILYIYSS